MFNNKKGEMSPITILIFCVIFFFGMTVVLNIIDNTSTDTIPTTTTDEICDTPRIAFKPNGDQYDVPSTSDRCIHTRGAIAEDSCNSMPGCTWENETIFFFWETGSQVCKGSIDFDALSNESLSPLALYNICSLSNLTSDEDTCYLYGCSWLKTNPKEMDATSNAKTIFQTLGELFTFQYDYGFDGLFAIVLNFVFSYLPTLLIIISGYYIFHPLKR